MKKTRIVCFILAFAKCGFLLAWGNQGHRVVVQVARNQLQQSTIDSVNFYLGGMMWESAATWMNDVKKTAQYDYMLSWHSISIERDKPFKKTEHTYPNIVNRIDQSLQTIMNRSQHTREEVKTALLVLFHLVGDLHQPLNCGYPDDRGGRRVKVEFLGRETNLYKVWEQEIIDEKNVDQWDGARINLAMTKAEIAGIKYGKVTDWLDESRLSLPQVYDYKYGMITEEYIAKNKPLIEKTLVKAGMRLAYLLSNIFGKLGSRCEF